jgi:outer membrane lipoprotein-sorting protein
LRGKPLRVSNFVSWTNTTGLALLSLLICGGCAVSNKQKVRKEEVRTALEATAEHLIAQYNQQARAVRSLNAAVELAPVTGSAYTGVIEQYHKVNGFILAQKPTHIRVIGQAPVVAKNIFDMVSNGHTFSIYIPSKNKFIVGPTALERQAKKPIENLRPQHLLDAFFWPEIRPDQTVFFEEFDAESARYYVLTLLHDSAAHEIARKVWFDRADLSLARVQLYGSGGRLLSDIHFSDWQPVADVRFPRSIQIKRPHDDYLLSVRIVRLTLNEEIAADRFHLAQPPGTELVDLAQESSEVRP